jgi:hypothetical protein
MKTAARIALGCFLSASLMVAEAGPEFAKTKRGARQCEEIRPSVVANAMAPRAPVALQKATSTDPAGKVILVLQTKEHRITVFSGEQELRYSVATDHGFALAEDLTASDLKGRFPELYEIITGTAWAGL